MDNNHTSEPGDSPPQDNAVLDGASLDDLPHVSLAKLRKLAKVTQEDLAHALHTSQTQVARIEKRGPFRGQSSTLRRYIERGLGFKLVIVVRTGDKTYLIN